MKLKSIKIQNYKSIEDIEFKIDKRNDSYAVVLLGKNETGKSNILEALSALYLYNEGKTYDFLTIRNQQNEPEKLSIFYTLEEENPDTYRAYIASKIEIAEEIVSKIIVEKAVKEVYMDGEDNEFFSEWFVTLKSIPTNNKYYLQMTKTIPGQVVNGTQYPSKKVTETKIVYWNDIKNLEEEIRDKYQPLTKEKFEEIIEPIIINYFNENELDISIWKPDSNYLIQGSISLKDFAKTPSKYPPLKNIFSLAGFNTVNDIGTKVKEIENHSNYRRKLQKQLSDETTKYLNTKWPEHKISIDIEISDELNIHVKVQDKDNTDAFHNMQERSQGFKHFVSLLLSLSVNHKTGNLKNSLILIDEPEVHLHPSGVRYMMKELLEIGKNNYIFIATHSNFMLDKNSKERHYLVSKKEGKTKIKQITSEEDLNNDEVLQAAFGINVIRDFVSDKKLLVEGASDKELLEKAMNKLDKKNCIVVSNGKGNNLPSVASLSGYYEIYPFIVVDDDEQGQNMKRDILKIGHGYTSKNVYTIRDLCGNIKEGGTIEDTLPKLYVESVVNNLLTNESISSITLDESLPFCEQIKSHLQVAISEDTISKKEKKDKIEKIMFDIKKDLSETFDIKTMETKAPLLKELAQKILDNFNS